MKKKVAKAWTESISIRGDPAKVYLRKVRGKHFSQAHTVNDAGRRGLGYPPAQ